MVIFPAQEHDDTSKQEAGRKKTESYKTALGRNIDEFRKECGWSFDKLAEKTGLYKTTILAHVRRGTGPRAATLKYYADAFTEGLNRPVTVADLER